MSQYSELMGSFLRTGNYPLEANYIFPTEEALKEFYQDPLNATTMHKGLLRVVENADGEQALYWVVKKQTNDELEFSKLIDKIDIQHITDQLQDLLDKLNQEAEDRKDTDTAVWGTDDPSNLPDELNSITDLVNAIQELQEGIEELRKKDKKLAKKLRATVGTEDNDIIGYLQTLPYQSLTEVAKALNKFLNKVEDAQPEISTLPELQSFLEGFTDQDKLKKVLKKLWKKIEGKPLPNEEFRTLRGIQDFIQVLEATSTNRLDTLQKEIDQTQIGVGLSGDGSYNSDHETHYLGDATSVMNALSILDGLVDTALKGITITTENTRAIEMSARKEADGYVLAAKLLLSNVIGNDLIKKEDGLYFHIVSEYENGILTLKANDRIVSQHALGFSTIVESIIYDSANEQLVAVFKLLNGEKQTVYIPVGGIIREWGIDNSIPDNVVELNREEVIDGIDKLSADVRISEKEGNILVKDGNSLYVNGTADAITYNGQHLSAVLQAITESITKLTENLADEVVKRAEGDQNLLDKLNETNLALKDTDAAVQSLNTALEAEVEDRKTGDTTLQNHIENVEDSVSDEQNRAITKESELELKISNESQARTEADQALKDDITEETAARTRAVAEEATKREEAINQESQARTEALAEEKAERVEKEAEIASSVTEVSGRVNNLSTQIVTTKVEVEAHIHDTNNPHHVTAEQVDTYTKTELDTLLQSKADLVGGVVPFEQMPYVKIPWIEIPDEN